MAVLSSDQLKAILLPLNINEEKENLFRSNCATIQEYSYESFRTRGNLSLPYGNVHSTIIQIRLRNFSENIAKYFFNSLNSSMPTEVSLVFNATFDNNGKLRDYDDAFIARGYIVETKEAFSTGDNDESQRSIDVKMLLSKIVYIGENTNSVLIISND